MDVYQILTAEAVVEVERLEAEIARLGEMKEIFEQTARDIIQSFGRDDWFALMDANAPEFQRYQAANGDYWAARAQIIQLEERVTEAKMPLFDAQEAQRKLAWEERGQPRTRRSWPGNQRFWGDNE